LFRAGRHYALLAGSFALVFGAFTVYWLSHSVVFAQPNAEKHLTVYSRQASYSVPLIDLNGQPYVGLVELLEPMGAVDARADGKKFKLRFSAPGMRESELQFHDGKDKGKVGGNNIKLAANFALQNGRGYVSLSSVSAVLSGALALPIRLNPGARRLFIGDVGKRFTLELRNGTPSKLFVSFDAPVNPTIATEPGHIRFTFRRDPVLPAIEQVSFADPLITGARFAEHDEVGELDVTATGPLMANFADGGKTIVITAAPSAPPQPIAQQAPPPSPATPPQPVEAQPKPTGPPRFFVLIDPAHGGTDIGAAIANDLPEKDVVLVLARRLQRELESRGIAAMLLRNSDITISLDQRAVSANAARPALYVALHAANTGQGVHVFTSMTEANSTTARDFLPWDRAQSAYVESSAAVAASVMAELVSRKLPNTLLPAPLRPMNNIAAPAIAVEIASPSNDVADIAKPAYQAQVAQAIADGIATTRNKPREAHP
jgi:N-acetylmuramoyl-L-alanine amidase